MKYSNSVTKAIVDDNVSMYVIKVRQDEAGEEAESPDRAALMALEASFVLVESTEDSSEDS